MSEEHLQFPTPSTVADRIERYEHRSDGRGEQCEHRRDVQHEIGTIQETRSGRLDEHGKIGASIGEAPCGPHDEQGKEGHEHRHPQTQQMTQHDLASEGQTGPHSSSLPAKRATGSTASSRTERPVCSGSMPVNEVSTSVRSAALEKKVVRDAVRAR